MCLYQRGLRTHFYVEVINFGVSSSILSGLIFSISFKAKTRLIHIINEMTVLLTVLNEKSIDNKVNIFYSVNNYHRFSIDLKCVLIRKERGFGRINAGVCM